MFISNIKFALNNNKRKKVELNAIDIELLLYHFDRIDSELRIENQRTNMTILETKLCKIIDDIDTASDIFKPNNESNYVKYIYSKIDEARKLFYSDGFKIYKKQG